MGWAKDPGVSKLKYRFPLCCSISPIKPPSHGSLEKLNTLSTAAKPASARHNLSNHLLIDQPEGVIEHEIATRTVRKQLEDLGIIHWSLLLVDLQCNPDVNNSCRAPLSQPRLTSSAPVTMTSIPPLSFEGCASRVDNLWTTFWNGRV